MPHLLTVADLSVRRGRHHILRDVSFQHDSGVLGITGVNGSGKTTLLSACSGELRPSAGFVSLDLDGRDVDARSVTRMLPQSFEYPKSLTIGDFVAYSAWINGRGRSSSDAAREALSQVQLADAGGVRLGAASGGMIRRAGLAVVLATDPAVLILDEPTTGVDPEQRSIMRELIASLSRDRLVLMSSHIAEDIEQLCEEMLVLHRGRLIFAGSPLEAQQVSGASSLEGAIIALPKAQAAA